MSDQMNVKLPQKRAETPPPKTSVGVIGWLKENLFSSWLNAILTLIIAIIVYFILKSALTWVFISAEWAVIANELRFLLVGRYPEEQVWRIWTLLLFFHALLGLSWGFGKGVMNSIAFTIGGLLFVSMLLPFIELSSRLWIIANLVTLLSFFYIGHKFPKVKKITYIGWFLSFPFVIFFINGLGILPNVSTNLWGGFMLNILLAVVAILCSFPLGILLALGRRSDLPVIKYFCIIYIEVIRGIPLITVLFMAKFMLPLFTGGIEVDEVVGAMVALTMFSAAYMAENVRGGLQSLPRGQFEASQALGLNSTYMMIFIILPQALKAVIPAIVGQYIAIFKDTTLVLIIGLLDILEIGLSVIAKPEYIGLDMEVLVFGAVVFFIFCYLMAHVSRRLEKSLSVGNR
ncbi:amino acid ABC transporter permease [Chengkuizengella marina]|uniref:Amino acid ABC transporter permease n=1 Tax=Chengkuizengella marina TaxID=2507566 RepID=A0A6N9PYU1_9BACL|nr:amino acid ABC transporter permease [Chengkuizengella marina]NBI27795.1 amino acid ABC transporter permease [Chengkuizengella marina]